MPTQFSRLLRPPAAGQPDPLVEQLKRRNPEAEREIARRYNRKIADRSRTIPEPIRGGSYDSHDPRLLALLWCLADNADALRALAARLGLHAPTPPDYCSLSDALLAQLWELGRDGTALERLWLRQGLLPVAAVRLDTPENVLGFLCWRQDRAAWDELLRRYALFDVQRRADDDQEYPQAEAQLLERFRLGRVPRPCQTAREFAALAAAKLLQLVPLWDYVAHPSVEHLLVKATHNELRDLARAARRRPSVSCDEAPEAADLVRAAPGSAAELQDFLAARLPLAERVVRKAQNGLDLADDELDWAARRNLAGHGRPAPAAADLAAERAAVARWLADNRSPTGDHLGQVFPWYRATAFGKASRLARLRLLIDEAEGCLDALAGGAPAEARDLRRQVRRGMDAFLHRTASGNRGRRGRPGPVVEFEALDGAARRLLHLTGDRPLDRRRADAFARLRDTFELFAEQFPVLVKLAACRRLARVVPGADGLAAWLDAGRQWLSSLHAEDRARCGDFARGLAVPGLATGSARPLLLAWLEATQRPGPAEARLACADRAWWLSRGREDLEEAADRLAEHARAGRWLAAAEAAALLLRRLGPVPETCWSAEGELRACLGRLRARRRDLSARREACRRLLAALRDGAALPAARLADWSGRVEALADGDAEEVALYREVSGGPAAPGAEPALGLLALWLQPAGESRFSARALKDLLRLWELTHDPWYTWPPGTPGEVAGIIAAARAGDWPQLAAAAARVLRRGPDLSGVSRSAGDEFRAALQRLARRRGQRTRARRAPP